jgi:glycosyltransferase involved in cell wall biosynthesis
MKLKRSGIIWVGNSRWGSNYGYVDHKGYTEVVQPLLKRRLPLDPFRIRDSFIRRIPNDQVLREIAESEILIQASAHEGTGLPLLEALGVGTIPITSDVGIAREVLTGYLEHLIVERNVNSFEHKIKEISTQSIELSDLCISAFDSFTEKIGAETIEWDRREINFSALDEKFSFAWRMRLIWLRRFYRSRWNR